MASQALCNIQQDGYIYIVQEREFVNLNQPIFRVGNTQTGMARIRKYPNDSKVFFMCNVENAYNLALIVIQSFKKQFTQQNNIGYRYFEGDINEMMLLICNLIQTKGQM